VRKVGGFAIAALRVNLDTLALKAARQSAVLFGREVARLR
jgi:hypothetical protein